MKAPRFAWECLGSPTYPPPVPSRGPQYGTDDRCWLCGDLAGDHPWPARLPETFTNHNIAAVPASQTVCQPCMYLAGTESWVAYVAAHPDRGWKAVRPLSWKTYPHIFSRAGHDVPDRAGIRALLLDPPDPPFLLIVPTSGQKHLIFRSAVAMSREIFPVQMEEQRILVRRTTFVQLLADFEALYRLGFSKDSIVSGTYHHGQLLTVGMTAWEPLEERIRVWRNRDPDLLALAHHVAQKEDHATRL